VTNQTPSAKSLLEHSLQVVTHGPSAVERPVAAHVAQILLEAMREPADELAATEVMNAIGHRLEDAAVVLHLLFALRKTSELEKLIRGVEQLAARAHREKFSDSLRHIVLCMIETPGWRDAVREEWVRDAISLAPGLAQRSTWRICVAWVRLHDSVPDWICEIVEHDPELFDCCFPDSWRWRLHSAAPTSHGWRFLARRREQGKQMLTPTTFGAQLDQAIETLEVAITEEKGETRRVVLAQRLSEIAG